MSEVTQQDIVTKTGSRLIAVRISEADKARAGEEIAGHLLAIIEAKDRGKSFASKIKEETDRREKQIDVLRQTLTTGTEQRQIPCEYLYDYNHASVTIIRLDTDPPEVLDKRAMTTDEFRLTQDPEPEEPPAAQDDGNEPEREPPPWEGQQSMEGIEDPEEPEEGDTLEQVADVPSPPPSGLPDFGTEPAEGEGIPDGQYPEVDEEEPPPAPGGPEGDPDSSPLGPVSDPGATAEGTGEAPNPDAKGPTPPSHQMPDKPKGGKKK